MADVVQIQDYVSTVSTGLVELSTDEVTKYRGLVGSSGLLDDVKKALNELLDNGNYSGFLSMWESLTKKEA